MNLEHENTVARIISLLREACPLNNVVNVEGTWGSFAPMLAACICQELGRPILYISPHIDDADNVYDDLNTFGNCRIELFSACEGQTDFADATDEIRSQRFRIAMKMASNKDQVIISASIQALCQPIPHPNVLESCCLWLKAGKQASPEQVIEWLVDNGFERVERVDLPGQFAHRGGIVDIYAPLVSDQLFQNEPKENPTAKGEQTLRIEFFGDTIESIRLINLDTQLSSRQIISIKIISAICDSAEKEREIFINVLPQNTIIILEEPNDIEQVATIFKNRMEKADAIYSWTDIYKAIKKFTQLRICRFAASDSDKFLKLGIKSVQRFQHKAESSWTGHKAALAELIQEAESGNTVLLYCETPAEIKRITEIINQTNKTLPANLKLPLGYIHRGFVISSLNTVIISHHELFGQFSLRRRQRPVRPSLPVDTLADLQPGDYVVHTAYGIGKFLGIRTITENDIVSEYLTIEYADKVKIHVSVSNITLIQKYIGTSPKRPKLSKVGSKKWQKQKQKVAESVQVLANQLLEVQAKRQSISGISYGPDSNWQLEFEQSFAYQETSDQTIAVEQIKEDMRQPVVMDRLLCGDVGYGKTELAMRAAFKAVEKGKQVAVLVPTTVLCVQHTRTFTDRFADFPVYIESLNRFKAGTQAADIVKRTKQGIVDILVGTHRLLSHDVGFKDLGLLIIDEEQRFGVEHKEKLKKLRINVDILTMTATPIPRTLHMSLLGLRDISSLRTPPLDRRSVVTSVTAYSKELIKKAIINELNRQGQVFFVHNRVNTIQKKAQEIQKLVSDAKIAVAHGQMPKSELETAMIDFVMGKIDVLVCTTIIESGLDIPNANTIFIDDADRFGLAQLHQLRGRVGRYKHRAYAYMLLPAARPVSPIAARRLKAIEEYSHLGAGFRIALRDLEIRGAGNILGPQQSGHIQMVGYQMYCDLLAQAVRKLKNEPVESIPTVAIDLNLTAYVPKNYIPVNKYRMDIYRKIAVAKTPEDLKQIENELTDVYGPVPQELKLLLELTELRFNAARLNIKAIVISGQNLVFSFTKDVSKLADKLFANVTGKIRISDPQTVYWHLPKNYFEPKTLLSILRKTLTR